MHRGKLICIAFAALAGCAGGERPVASDALMLTSDAELPVPKSVDQLAATREYLVGPADKLRVDAYPLEDLSREVLVDSAGWISFPLAGQLRVSGKSPADITLLIE